MIKTGKQKKLNTCTYCIRNISSVTPNLDEFNSISETFDSNNVKAFFQNKATE